MAAGDLALNIIVSAATGGAVSAMGGLSRAISMLATDPMAAVGVAAAVAGAAMVGFGVKSVQAASEFQGGMTSLVTGAGEAQANLGMVSQGILQLSVDTATSVAQLTSGMYMIESAGYHGAAGLQVLQTAAEGAKVGNADLGVTANALTTILTDYHLKASDATGAMNALITTVASGKTHLQDLAGAMGSVLPLASSLGISFPQVAAAIATMTNSGMDAQRASMNLANTIRSLAAPNAAAEKSMKAVGLSAQQLHDVLSKQGLAQAIQLVEEHVNHTFPAGSVAAVEAFKKIMGGATGYNVALMLGGKNMAAYESNINKISAAMNAGGNAVQGWSMIQEDFNFKLEQAKSALNVLMIQIGTALLPLVGQVIGMLANLVIGLISIITWLQGTSDAANIVRTVLAGLALGVAIYLTTLLPGLIAGFLGYAAAAWAAAAAVIAATWPFLLLGVAIIGVIAALKWAYDNIAIFHSWINSLIDALQHLYNMIASRIMRIIQQFWEWLQNRIIPVLHDWWTWIYLKLINALQLLSVWLDSHVLSALRQFWEMIQNNILPVLQGWFSWLENKVIIGLQDLARWLQGQVNAALQLFWQIIQNNILPVLQSWWSWLENNVIAALQDLTRWLQGQVDAALQSFWQTIQNHILPALSSWWNWLEQKIIGALQDLSRWLNNQVFAALQSFWQTIQNHILPALQAWWNAIEQKMIGALQDLSKWLNNQVAPAMQDFWQGILNHTIPALQAWRQEIENKMIPALHDLYTAMQNKTITAMQNFKTTVETQVIPATQGWWQWTQQKMMPALGAIWIVLQNEVIPVILNLWRYIQNNLIPTLQSWWQWIQAKVTPVLEVLWQQIQDGTKRVQDFIATVQKIVGAFQEWEKKTGLLKTVTIELKTSFNLLKNFIKDELQPVLDKLKKSWEDIKKDGNDLHDAVFNKLLPALNQLWTLIQQHLLPGLDRLSSLFGSTGDHSETLALILEAYLGGVIVFITALLGGLIGALASFLDGLIGFVKGVIEIFSGLGIAISNTVTFIVDLVNGRFEKLWYDEQNIWQGIALMFKGVWDVIVGVFQMSIGAIVGFVAGFIATIQQYFSDLNNNLVGHSIVPDMMTAIIACFAGLPGRTLAAVFPLSGMIGGFFSNLAGMAANWGQRIIQGLISGMNSMWGSLAATVSNIAGLIGSYLPHSPAKRGELSHLNEYGPALMRGIAQGITSSAPLLHTSLSNALAPVGSAFSLNGSSSGGAFALHAPSNGSNQPQTVNMQIQLDGKTITEVVGVRLAKEVRIQGGVRSR